MATYIAGKVYNLHLSYGQLDILLSGFPMTLTTHLSINGVELQT